MIASKTRLSCTLTNDNKHTITEIFQDTVKCEDQVATTQRM